MSCGPNSSDVFYCPECHQTWGARHNIDASYEASAPVWSFVVRLCEKHGNGSLLLPDEVKYDWVEELPIDLLRRELELIFNDMIKQEENENATATGD